MYISCFEKQHKLACSPVKISDHHATSFPQVIMDNIGQTILLVAYLTFIQGTQIIGLLNQYCEKVTYGAPFFQFPL